MSDLIPERSPEHPEANSVTHSLVKKPSASSGWLDGLMKTASRAARNITETAQEIARDPGWAEAGEALKIEANQAAQALNEKVIPQLSETARHIAQDPKLAEAGRTLQQQATSSLQILKNSLSSRKECDGPVGTEKPDEQDV